jgi:Putative Ig domain
MKKVSVRVQNESGESLIEVVISAVILGLIGLLLVTSVATAKPFADKMSLMGQGVAGLNTAAEAINVQSFAHCVPNNNQPYSLSVPASPNSDAVTGFAITTNELPPVLVGSKYSYQLQLQVQNAPGALTWAVEPPLPNGLSLNPNSGVISGKTDSPITSEYVFTARNGNSLSTKHLTLSAVLVEVLENNGTAWVDCSQIPITQILSSSSDGKTTVYSTASNPIANVGNLVTIWGSSNSSFDGNSVFVTANSSNSLTTLDANKGVSTGGYIGQSRQVDIEEVVLSTIVSGTPLKKIVVKSAA